MTKQKRIEWINIRLIWLSLIQMDLEEEHHWCDFIPWKTFFKRSRGG